MKLDMNQQQLLARYHDGQTTDAENQQVQSLIAGNPDCQKYLNELTQLSQSLQSAYTSPRISQQLADRLRDIPHAAQEHVLTRLAGGWSLAACILLLFSALAIFQYQANTTIDSDAWQLDRMAIGHTTSQYGVELTDNHRDLQLASLLISQG
ncbi:MAG: anti-sigma factor family protein, partial [Phycisphaeraceae bacterium JB051]